MSTDSQNPDLKKNDDEKVLNEKLSEFSKEDLKKIRKSLSNKRYYEKNKEKINGKKIKSSRPVGRPPKKIPLEFLEKFKPNKN